MSLTGYVFPGLSGESSWVALHTPMCRYAERAGLTSNLCDYHWSSYSRNCGIPFARRYASQNICTWAIGNLNLSDKVRLTSVVFTAENLHCDKWNEDSLLRRGSVWGGARSGGLRERIWSARERWEGRERVERISLPRYKGNVSVTGFGCSVGYWMIVCSKSKPIQS